MFNRENKKLSKQTNGRASAGCATARDAVLTWRSAAFGLLGIWLMSGLAAYHDDILDGTLMIGNHIPGGAFTYVMFLGLGWNGLCCLARRRSLALSSRELAVVMAVTLAACFPPTSGLFRYFHRAVMLPWYYLASKSAWAAHGVLSEQFMRPQLFPSPWPGAGVGQAGYEVIYRGFFTGLATGSSPLSFGELAEAGIFKAWLEPIAVWGPLVMLMAVAAISLQYLVHRQWSKHEQLGYPVAHVAASFCAIKDGGRGVPEIFKSRLFWMGFCPVFAVLLLIALSAWHPQNVPGIRELGPNFKGWWIPLDTRIPVIKNAPDWWAVCGQTVYFTIIGLAYFVSAEISLTMSFTAFSQCLFGTLFFLSTGQRVDGGWMASSRAGAYVCYTAILIWTGRHYYGGVFRKAFRLGGKARRQECEADIANASHREPEADARAEADAAEAAAARAEAARAAADDEALSVTAARMLLLSLAGFIIVLSWICQSWLMAVFYALLLFVMFLVVSRIVCETGIPFIHTHWNPGGMLLKLLGPAAIGPQALPFLLHSTAVLCYDPRESLMPYIGTGAKLAEENGARLRRLYWIVTGAVLLAIVIAFFATTYAYYNYNPMTMSNQHAAVYPPQMYLDQAAGEFSLMKSTGVFEKSLSATPFARLAMARASAWDLKFFVSGFIGVLALTVMRLRYSKFPIHPVLLLVAGTYGCNAVWGSFMIGWFIKMLVVRFGGGGVYQKLKPFFIGIIAAELFMVGALVALDFAYYAATGNRPPVNISIMPG